MTRSIRLSRRTVLRGMLGGAGVALGLPLLDVMLDERGEALANGSPLPTRFGLWWWGNGNQTDRWTPSTIGTNYTLTSPLEALAPVQSDILLVTGLEIRVPNTATHRSGRAGLLTGLPATRDTPTWYSKRTIDRVLADTTGEGLRFRSLDTSVGLAGAVVAEGPFTPMQATSNPAELYNRIFQAPPTGGTGPDLATLVGLRRSALDVISEDARRLHGRVSTEDRHRLGSYLDNVRAFERQLATLQGGGGGNSNTCAELEHPEEDGSDTVPDERKLAVNRLMARGIGVALACDLTRVFTHQFSRPGGDIRYLNEAEGHHSLTHFEPNDQPTVAAIVKVIMQALSEFIAELRAVDEGGGKLLDNMVMLATSEVSDGRTHSLRDLPVILAGSGRGTYRMGEHVAVPARTNASDLMLTLMRRSGLQLPSFGEDSAFSNRELTEILR